MSFPQQYFTINKTEQVSLCPVLSARFSQALNGGFKRKTNDSNLFVIQFLFSNMFSKVDILTYSQGGGGILKKISRKDKEFLENYLSWLTPTFRSSRNNNIIIIGPEVSF